LDLLSYLKTPKAQPRSTSSKVYLWRKLRNGPIKKDRNIPARSWCSSLYIASLAILGITEYLGEKTCRHSTKCEKKRSFTLHEKLRICGLEIAGKSPYNLEN